MAKITVIVPVYKVEDYLARCINSILKQTYIDYELVLVDDGSPDRCGDICEEYARTDKRIIALHRENGGLSAARNTGIDWAFAHSSSEYLTFIDSDDWIHSQYLEELLYAIQKSDAAVSVCCQRRANEYAEEQMRSFLEHAVMNCMSAEELLLYHEWNYNYAWGKLYKKEYFSTVRYPEGKNFEDTFTTYKVLFAGEKVAWIDRELYFYFINNEGISKSLWTPKELVIFEGMQQQMRFYKEQGYTRALEKEEQLYVNHYAYQICRIRENKKDLKKNKVYLRQLKREMMCWVHQFPEKYSYRKMPQCYDAAYPLIMKGYHKLGAVVHKAAGR